MYSPKIYDHLIPIIYREAKAKGKPMTKIVNDILEENLTVNVRCSKCNSIIEAYPNQREVFCDFCDCVVFVA